MKSSECYNLIQLPWQRSTSRRSVSSVWMLSVASLCLPGRCGFTASPGAGPRVIPLVLSCRDEEKRYERCRQPAGGRGKTKKHTKLLTVTFIRCFLGLSVAVIIIFCIPVDKDGDFSGILNQGHRLGRKHTNTHTHTHARAHTQLTRLLAAVCSSFHNPHNQILDKTLHKTERKGMGSTVRKPKLQ